MLDIVREGGFKAISLLTKDATRNAVLSVRTS